MIQKNVSFFAGGSALWSEPVPVEHNVSLFVQESKFTAILSIDGEDIALMCFMTGYDKIRDDGVVIDAKGHAAFVDSDGEMLRLTFRSCWGDDDYRIEFRLASGTGKWTGATGTIKGTLTLLSGIEDDKKFGAVEAEGAINMAEQSIS